MKLKSEMTSGIMIILLGALVLFSALNLVGTIVYVTHFDFYLKYIYSFDGFVELLAFWLYYIILVLYLIWIYRVHIDLNARFPDYPRTPGTAIACMIIPIYNLYGIPSTYSIIGEHYQSRAFIVGRKGRWISGLAVPLLLLVYASKGLNQYFLSQSAPSDALLLTFGTVELVQFTVFLVLCLLVSRVLKLVQIHDEEIYQQNEDMELESGLYSEREEESGVIGLNREQASV